jgi:DNA (cytosine-5)-methyltransferase 1
MNNKQDIILVELFSGIGGFTKGFEDAGFTIKKHYFSEVDRHAIANYKHNYPNAEYLGSVTNVRHIIRTINTQPHILTFGSPCQDFSLAGKRSGMQGNRSSLIRFALFLIRWLKPHVFIWENVKGAYSTNFGADYWGIIQAFAHLPGYRCEQQLLNTAWVLPQNRERIYLVGHLTERSECGVFPITESNGIYPKTHENKEKIHSNSLTLTAKGNSNNTGSFIEELSIISYTRDEKGKIVNHNTKHEANTIHSSTGSGNNTDQYVQIATPNHGRMKDRLSDIAPTLQQTMGTGGDNVPYVITSNDDMSFRAELRTDINENDIPHIAAQRSRSYKGQNAQLEHRNDGLTNTLTSVDKDNYVVISTNNAQGYETATEGDSINFQNLQSKTRRGRVGKQIAQTLDTAASIGVVVSANNVELNLTSKNQRLKKTIENNSFEDGKPQGLDVYNQSTSENYPTITDPSHNYRALYDGRSIRRLTEIECERLQGFPDDWTKYGNYDGIIKPIAKTQRYKLLGNAVTAKVVELVASRIKLL